MYLALLYPHYITFQICLSYHFKDNHMDMETGCMFLSVLATEKMFACVSNEWDKAYSCASVQNKKNSKVIWGYNKGSRSLA